MSSIEISRNSLFKSLYINERLAGFREGKFEYKKDMSYIGPSLTLWRKMADMLDAKLFDKKVHHDGLRKDIFEFLISPSTNAQQYSDDFHWLKTVRDAASYIDQSISKAQTNKPSLANFVEPFVIFAISELESKIPKVFLQNISKDNKSTFLHIRDSLEQDIKNLLLDKAKPTLVLELNVCRIMESIGGETSKEKFNSFCRNLSEREEFWRILMEYPMLSRIISESLWRWIDSINEMLHRLCDDWPIQDILQDKYGDMVTDLRQISGALSDQHRNGRTVRELTFKSGQKIIYKPRSLSVDEVFQNFLLTLNKLGVAINFPTISVVDRGDYGWSEYVENSECKTKRQVTDFYKRIGGYIAILYAIGGTDIHRENLIASGEYPILIDLETIFHHSIDLSIVDGAITDAINVIDQSVLSTGFLPSTGLLPEEEADFSGIGSQKNYINAETWINDGTDKMRLSKRRVKLEPSSNTPQLNGSTVDPSQYMQSVLDGFRDVYLLMMDNKNFLLDEGGIIDSFANVKIRHVFGATRIYNLYIHKGHHPNNLRDAIYKEALVNRLWKRVQDRSFLEIVIDSEIEDLLNEDIPIFTSTPNSKDIHDSRGKLIRNFFSHDSLSISKQKLENFDARDMNEQLDFIRASFAISFDLQLGQKKSRTDFRKHNVGSVPLLYTDCVNIAREIGDKIISSSVRSKSEAMWVGPTLMPGNKWNIMPLGHDLYGGTSGIALFMGYLWSVTKDEKYMELAIAAINGARNQLFDKEYKIYESLSPSLKLVIPGGGFVGVSSVVYSMLHLGHLLKQHDLISDSLKAIDGLYELVESDERLDILGGAAGSILVLISAYKLTNNRMVLDVAERYGNFLVKKSIIHERGCTWPSVFSDRNGLIGFSHGNAGFAYALSELASVTSNNDFLLTAIKAMEYERSVFFSKSSQSEESERVAQGMMQYKDINSISWCNGAPGIALARLYSYTSFSGEEKQATLNDALSAIQMTILGPPSNHSLCHGALGSVEALLVAFELLKKKSHMEEAENVISILVTEMKRTGIRFGTPGNITSYGLMTGYAGTGLGLLRFAVGHKIPSILALRPPQVH